MMNQIGMKYEDIRARFTKLQIEPNKKKNNNQVSN